MAEGWYVASVCAHHCVGITLPRSSVVRNDGEIRLAGALETYVKDHPVYAASIKGDRFDCGSKLGWLQANVAFALKNKEFGKDFRKYLKEIC